MEEIRDCGDEKLFQELAAQVMVLAGEFGLGTEEVIAALRSEASGPLFKMNVRSRTMAGKGDNRLRIIDTSRQLDELFSGIEKNLP